MIGRPIGSVVDACAANFRNETAIVHGDRRMSYAEAIGDIRATGRALRSLGLEPGDRVAFAMSDSPELMNMMWGALWAGLTIVPLNARLALDDHVYMVEDSGARALAFNGATTERGHEILDRTSVDLALSTDPAAVPEGGHLLPRLVANEDSGPGCPDADPAAECWIQYTGGTTGLPKGTLHSHDTMLAAMYSCAFELAVEPGEVCAHVAPLTHSGLAYFLPVWMRGGTNVILGGFDPVALLDTIERERVTSTLMVPTMLYVLLDLPGITDKDLSSLRTICYGAAPMGRERLEQALDAFGPIFLQVYGQTEAPAQITVLTKRDHVLARERPELLLSCGRPVTIAEVRVADDELADVPAGQPGEVLVRGPHVTLGYENKPEETATALRDGWLCTGDIGRRDEDGYVYLVDRKKDMIVSGGFNVYPKEVEQALFQHPGVADVCVIGVPDEKWGEAVKAVIVPGGGADVAEDDLIAFVKERKSSMLAPKSIDFVESIPLTSVGKHDKAALRDVHWRDRERAVG
jgi:fatty-acyl-CoA synthase